MKHFGPLDGYRGLFFSYHQNLMRIRSLLIQCLFEAQTVHFCVGNELSAACHTSLDTYLLGYCIANCLPGVLLHVTLDNLYLDSFVCGLDRCNAGSDSSVKQLHLQFDPSSLDLGEPHALFAFRSCTLLHRIVCCIIDLPLTTASALFHITEFISQSTSLRTLGIRLDDCIKDYEYHEAVLTFLQQVADSRITSLSMIDAPLFPKNLRENFLFVLNHLICLKLVKFSVENSLHEEMECRLFKVMSLSTCTSLKAFSVVLSTAAVSSFSCLKSNTSLTELEIHFEDMCKLLPQLVEILKYNKTLHTLKIAMFHLPVGIKLLIDINIALKSNETLKCVELFNAGPVNHDHRPHGIRFLNYFSKDQQDIYKDLLANFDSFDSRITCNGLPVCDSGCINYMYSQ